MNCPPRLAPRLAFKRRGRGLTGATCPQIRVHPKTLPQPRRGGQAPSGKEHAQNKLDLIALIIDRFHGSMPSILARRFLTSNRLANQSSEQLTAVSGDGLSVVQSQVKPAIFFLLGSHALITPERCPAIKKNITST
jgi:hypothetical protein